MKVQVAVIVFAAILQKIHGATIAQTPNLDDTLKTSNVNTKGSNVFDPKTDAENIKKAVDTTTIDSSILINILTSRTTYERLAIAAKYKDLYNENLSEVFKNKLDTNLANLLVAIITPTNEYYAKELYDSMHGAGTDNGCLIEILSTLSNENLKEVREAYHKAYGVTLESDIKKDTSGHFAQLLTTLCNGVRDESNEINQSEAVADAVKLYEAGEKKWGTDESAFISVLTERNPKQLKQVFTEYERLTGHDMEYTIECEFSGLIKKGLLSVASLVTRSLSDYLAERLNESIAGSGYNKKALTRIIATRSGTDMEEPIKSSYANNYGSSLKKAIVDDTSGDYKTCLLALLGER